MDRDIELALKDVVITLHYLASKITLPSLAYRIRKIADTLAKLL
jgi:hypothetical protein